MQLWRSAFSWICADMTIDTDKLRMLSEKFQPHEIAFILDVPVPEVEDALKDPCQKKDGSCEHLKGLRCAEFRCCFKCLLVLKGTGKRCRCEKAKEEKGARI